MKETRLCINLIDIFAFIIYPKKMKNLYFVFLGLMLIFSCSERKTVNDQDKIRIAIEAQLKTYPSSTLADIYKSFFQDWFGPGHLLSDTAAARDYMFRELEGMQSRQRYLAEPCGLGRNFVRVPLDLVKDSLVDMESYLRAFMESAQGFTIPNVEEWKKEWNGILSIIIEVEPEMEYFEEHRRELDNMLARGEYMVHHSALYRERYVPHYRIMTVAQWESLSEKINASNPALP